MGMGQTMSAPHQAYQGEQVTRRPCVDAAIERISSRSQSLRDAVEQLKAKLDPVLLPESLSAVSNKPDGGSPNMSGTQARLLSLDQDLGLCESILRDLYARLDL